MTFRGDNRAQSTLIGFILLFGILVLAFAGYQAVIVPDQNAEVEFNHNDEVQTDMQDVRNSLLDVRSTQEGEVVSEHRPVRVKLGTQYPARLIALNPPSAAGTLEAEPAESEFRITNAEVAGNFDGDPENQLLGNDPEADLSTAFLQYQPGYSEYQDPPTTTLEHSLLYNQFSNTNLTVREQTLIRPESNRLNIVLFEGEFSRSQSGAVTLDPETIDGPTAPVPIESDNGPITLEIPTQSPEFWEERLSQIEGIDEGDIETFDDSVEVELPEDEYTLRVTRVGYDGDGQGDTFTEIQPSEVEVDRNITYAVQWDADRMANQGGVSYDEESNTLTVNQDQIQGNSIDGFATVQEAEEPNEFIQDVLIDFGRLDEDVVRPDSEESTNEDGIAEIDVGIDDEGETRIFAAGGDDVGTLNVEVIGEANTLTLEADQDEIDPGDENELTATYEDEDGDPIAEEDVTFDIIEGEGSLEDADEETDGDGEATVTYQSVEDDEGDEIEIEVEVVDTGETARETFDVSENGEEEQPQSEQVSGVDGTIDRSNIAQGGRQLEFDIEATEEVTLDDFDVETKNDMDDQEFEDDGSEFDGESPPVTFDGQISVEIRDIGPDNWNVENDDFVDPDSDNADIVVTLIFEDSSELNLGISASS